MVPISLWLVVNNHLEPLAGRGDDVRPSLTPQLAFFLVVHVDGLHHVAHVAKALRW
jgi:hypothetical protein